MMILLILLFTSGAVTGEDAFPPGYTTYSSLPQSYPSCFTEETTWANVESTGIIPGVDNVFSCQELCLEFPACKQFTWYTEQAIPFGFTCLLYDDPTTEYHCTNCVSGPQSCLCSGSYSCQITDNNFVGEVPQLETELLCQDHCSKTNNCNFYTWLEEEIFPKLCLMLSSCDEKEFNCKTCHSGPADCRNIAVITTPTNITTLTPTTKTPMPTTTSSTTITPNVSCDLPAPQIHGDWFCPPSSDLPTCHLECHPGYVSTIATVITCHHGEWSEDPECITAMAIITGGTSSQKDFPKTVEVYGEGIHKKLPNLPDNRIDHTMNMVNSVLLLCGGFFTSTRTSCLSFTASHQWTTHSTTTSERRHHSSVSMMGQLHLLGGQDSLSTTEHLTPPSNDWKTDWDLLENTKYSCATKIEPEMFIMTGTSAVMYNVTSGTATRLQDLIIPRILHGCASVRDSNTGFRGVLVAGGFYTHSEDQSEMYNMKTGEWSSTGKLTTGRKYVKLVVLGENILAMGGKELSSVDKFNITSGTWAATEEMMEARYNHAVAGVPPGLVGIVLN